MISILSVGQNSIHISQVQLSKGLDGEAQNEIISADVRYISTVFIRQQHLPKSYGSSSKYYPDTFAKTRLQ